MSIVEEPPTSWLVPGTAARLASEGLAEAMEAVSDDNREQASLLFRSIARGLMVTSLGQQALSREPVPPKPYRHLDEEEE
jgi:hypothetical protein